MNWKSYIAIFLIPLFLGKLLMIDANVISLLNNEIEVVNPYCKKEKLSKNTKKKPQLEQHVETYNSKFSINSFCTPQLNLLHYTWEPGLTEFINTHHTQLISRLSYLYLDSHSPPPRQV
ncbi:hypothetical protein [Gramella sp. KN1008]|uniref:hypothetical protein n=1 Tax=Gramella sp. KN1008 TaxID=2529298 RepID=UPI00103E2075|nr:hypothetical protein [Gramella sp. KN1008]TBW26391.1 hypothetical protein EZJ28_14395 [Gramella sp. KN1008]